MIDTPSPSSRLRAAAVVAIPAILAIGAGCAPPPPRTQVEVRIAGRKAAVERVRKALAGDLGAPVDVRFAELPSVASVPPPTGPVEVALGAARKHYLQADAGRCLALLGEDAILPPLFLDGRRATAARVLFWRVACRVAASENEHAARAARDFASMGFEVPVEAGSTSPEVEFLIARAMREAASSPPSALRIESRPVGASVSIDGRPAACATPCTMEVPSGVHFVGLHREGMLPAVRRVTASGRQEVAITLARAGPDVAAEQWAARYAGSPLVDSNASVLLLAQAARARQLSLLVVDETESPRKLRGVLAVDGAVRARAEQKLVSADQAGARAPALLHELLVDGRVIESKPLVKNPWFWVAIAAATGAAIGITYAAVHERPTVTEIHF